MQVETNPHFLARETDPAAPAPPAGRPEMLDSSFGGKRRAKR